MYNPVGHPNIFLVGNRYVSKFTRNGERFTKRYGTENEAIEDYERFRSTIPTQKIFTVVRFTNTDETSPDYNMRYVQLGQNKTPPFPNFNGANGRQIPAKFSTTVLLTTPNRILAKIKRDEEILKDHAENLSYNRADLIAAPGVYHVCKAKGYVRTPDGVAFRRANGIEHAKEHIARLVADSTNEA